MSSNNLENMDTSIIEDKTSNTSWKPLAIAGVTILLFGGLWYLWDQNNSTKLKKTSKKPKDSTKKKRKSSKVKGVAKDASEKLKATQGSDLNLSDSFGHLDSSGYQSSSSFEMIDQGDENYEDFTEENISELSTDKRNQIAQVLKSKGNRMYNSKSYEEALKFYSQALRFKEDSTFHANKAACYNKLKQFNNVIEECNRVIELDPNYMKAYHRRGTAHESLEEYRAAVKDYFYAMTLASTPSQDTREALTNALTKILEDEKKKFHERDQQSLPHPQFVSLWLSNNNESFDFKDKLQDTDSEGDQLLLKAIDQINANEIENAMSTLNDALAKESKNKSYIYYTRGIISFVMQQLQTAINYFDKAIEHDSNNAFAYFRKAQCLIVQGDTKAADTLIDKAESVMPSYSNIYWLRAQLDQSSNPQKSIEDLQKAIELDSNNLVAFGNLALLYVQIDKTDEAKDLVNVITSKVTDSAIKFCVIGEIYLSVGDLDKAKEFFNKSLELDDQFVVAYINHAGIAYQHQDFQKAHDFFVKAFEACPDPQLHISTLALIQISLFLGKFDTIIRVMNEWIDNTLLEDNLHQFVIIRENAIAQQQISLERPDLADKLKSLASISG